MSIRQQCALLGLNRASYYYTPVPESQENLAVMRRIDELYLQYPFFGSRQLAAWLSRDGVAVHRKRVQRLMRRMGLVAISPGPRTTSAGRGHKIYPYRLRGVAVDPVDQVWSVDITEGPMARGFLYLMAVVDWYSRYVLAWRLSNSLEAEFCVEALAKGMQKIFNSYQGV